MDALGSRLAAAKTAAAVGPVLARGILRLRGKDRQKFVHRICTQKVDGLAPGAAAHVAFLDAKGHVLADATLVVRADDLLLDVEPRAAEALRAHLSKYVVMDQVQIEDVSPAWRVVPAIGPAGVELARTRAPAGATTWENGRRGAPALDVLLEPEAAGELRSELISAGATPLGEDDLEVLRVLAGIPRFGSDFDASRLPMEAALIRTAVSFEKGCYLGQEVVLRGTFRGQIQRGLVQLALPPGAGPGTPLVAGGQEVGSVTTALETPEGRIGLGYLRRAHWNEGERVSAGAGEAIVRRVLVQERDR